MDKTRAFIEKAKKVHGDRYDYSKVEYVNNHTNVCIICKEHGEFLQTPGSHKAGRNCMSCSIVKRANLRRRSLQQFIDNVNKVHKFKYDYSLVGSFDRKKKITIMCPLHGKFNQNPHNHQQGQGCPDCGGSKPLTTQEFIDRAKLIHGDLYDYSVSKYNNIDDKITIICKKHGKFYQRAYNHLKGHGCLKCVGWSKTTEQFINEAKSIHKDRYDYSSTKYINTANSVSIRCKKHGIFQQYPSVHLKGHGCIQCSGVNKKTTDEFIKESRSVHRLKYDYSETNYKNRHGKVIIICKTHGEFHQNAGSHLQGCGCPYCGGNTLKSTEEFIIQAKEKHNDLYDYSKSIYKSAKQKIKIICKTHGEFHQEASSHLMGCGCPKCRPPQSKTARKWLNLIKTIAPNLITWESPGGEYRIPGTRWHADGYDPDTNTIYEYHGWYWHGCPMMYPREKMNKVCGKTMGELYDATKAREKKIKEMGYNLCAIWGE